jgi:hypothetical protein
MGEAVRKEELELAETMPRTSTLVMASRPIPTPVPPRPVASPAARSVQIPSVPPDLVVFHGEKLASVDDFVRLRLKARSITFHGVLMRAGITPEYYAMMCERFADARRADPSLEQRYRARLELATKGR